MPVKGGTLEIGREWINSKFYGWDNEFGNKNISVIEDFEIS